MKDQYSTVEFDATAIRSWFATQLAKIAQTLKNSEKKSQEVGASGELALSALIDNLDREVNKLVNEKFRFLIIGDFNRGKSSILNVLFGKELLPMGVTATTSIPTVVKYGKEQKVNVVVHKKDGTEENLSLEGYKNKYTLNSKDVKDKIKRIYNSVVGGWLKDLDYADFYCPVDLLSKGVEFIDTAGLNHTDDEDMKTLAYIPECHAIFFVLSAEQQLTAKEKEYLNKHIKDKIGTVFFLINKWELLEESDKEEVHNTFVDGLSECLQIEQSEVEKMWGYSVFDVYAQTALKRLAEQKHLDGTGFIEFNRRLNKFLIHERLTAELLPSVQIATSVKHQVVKLIDERLLILNETVKSLEEKIKKVNPYIDVMERIVKSLKEGTQIQKNACIIEVLGKYESYFAQVLNKIDNDFVMPSVSGLKDNQKEDYKKILEKKFQEYQQEKLNGWEQISQGIVTKTILELTNLFQEESNEYEKKRREIQEILSGKDYNSHMPKQSTYETNSTGETSLKVINASAAGKMILAGGGAAVGTVTAGVGAAYIANLAGAHILLGTIGTSLVLTPIGWGLLAVSAAGGGLAAWWGRRSEIEKFQRGMKEQIKKGLKTILEPDKLLGIQEKVGTLFVGFENCTKELKDDIESLKNSLNNLLESKKKKEFDSIAEATRLQELKANIYTQWEDIDAKYAEIATAKSK
ncbi:hypothetical protein RIVM261_076800 [Rivularia sp. IAM M-261]|nr:hypothetical protein RIVM261_076800 [Rivularia sp. IAM M-261]